MISLILFMIGFAIQSIGLILNWAGISNGIYAVAFGSGLAWSMLLIGAIYEVYCVIHDAILKRKASKELEANLEDLEDK